MLVSTFSPPIRVGPGFKLSVNVQSSLRLPVFDSIGLVRDTKADLKLLMTSGGGENKMADRADPAGTDLLLWGPLKFHL